MEKIKHFYPQGIPLSNDEYLEATGRAISQEDKILEVMTFARIEWTAWRLKDTNTCGQMEITSIRRSLFNLNKQGKIARVGFTPGPKGKPCGKYIAFTGKLF